MLRLPLVSSILIFVLCTDGKISLLIMSSKKNPYNIFVLICIVMYNKKINIKVNIIWILTFFSLHLNTTMMNTFLFWWPNLHNKCVIDRGNPLATTPWRSRRWSANSARPKSRSTSSGSISPLHTLSTNGRSVWILTSPFDFAFPVMSTFNSYDMIFPLKYLAKYGTLSAVESEQSCHSHSHSRLPWTVYTR